MAVYEELSETQQFACRVIADHARATAFAIADGILPGNEGRNYVLRKIMRRAIYHGREHLGRQDAFFYKVCDAVVDKMHDAFPELETQRGFIAKMVKLEEQRFGNTLTTGLGKFSDIDMFIARVRDEELEFTNTPDFVISLELPRRPAKRSFNFAKNGQLKAVKLIFADGTEEMAEPNSIPSNERKELERQHQDIRRVFDLGRQLGGFPNAEQLQRLKDVARIAKIPPTLNPEVLNGLGAIRGFLDYVHKQELFQRLAGLYDTFGVPRDLMRLKLEERGIEFDESEFNENLDTEIRELQKQSSIGKTERKSEVSPVYAEVLDAVGKNIFHGYETTEIDDATIIAILDGDKQLDALNEGEQAGVVLDSTPFYAESGGQVGDTGMLVGETASPLKAMVSDTYSPVSGLIVHKVKVEKGSIKVGDSVSALVDVAKRDAARRNHTATHLLHAALKEVLGSHVKQAGSVVAPNYLRFDFAHYQAMTADEIAETEDLVNRYILQNEPVTTDLMKTEDAMRSGAVAMFGEKYGAEVRVLSVGNGEFSRELCGGTHVRATGDIGSFKIVSDEAIASGVRRIRAITGLDAFNRFREDERLIDASLGVLKTQRDNLANAIERLQDDLKRSRKEIDELRLKIATGGGGGAADDDVREIAGVKVVAKIVEDIDANGMRQLSDTLLARLKSGVVVVGRRDEAKAGLIVRVSGDLTSRIKAGDIIREIAPVVGGKGGGKPDMAEGGGPDVAKLQDALDAACTAIGRLAG